MSILNDYQKSVVEDFRGPNYLVEPTDVKPPWCLDAQNVEYEPGSWRTRLGYYAHTGGLTPVGVVRAAHNFVRGAVSRLIWCVPSAPFGLLVYYIADYNATSPLGPFGYALDPSSIGASFAQYGRWLYVAHYDANFSSNAQPAIVDMEDSPTFYSTVGFKRPRYGPGAGGAQEISISTAYSAGGSLTTGGRYVAVLFQDRSGFVTRPSPVINDAKYTTNYAATSTSSASQKVTITITPSTTWPTDYVKAYLVVTTTTNIARLIYADVEPVAVPGGAATPISFVLSSPDSVLAEQPDIGDQESVMVVSFAGDVPFTPYYTFTCGSRMGYLCYRAVATDDQVFKLVISDPENPQRVLPDLNVLELPQQRQGVCAYYFQGTVYVFGPDWTYAYTDNGDSPVLWAPPRTIDEKIGTSHPQGITIEATGFGFVAHRSGLYVFSGGQYDRLPISYFQSTLWRQIDWTGANFTMAMDSAKYQIKVFCQFLDGSRQVLMWDYTEGTGPTQAKFSVHTLADGNPRWGLMVINKSDARFSGVQRQLWIAGATGASAWLLQRHPTDAAPYVDGTATNIPTVYDMPYLPAQRQSLVLEHHGMEVRALGVGNLLARAYKLDRQSYQQLANTPLTSTPAKEYTRFLDVRSEQVSYRFQNGSNAGDWVRISIVRHYHTPFVMQR